MYIRGKTLNSSNTKCYSISSPLKLKIKLAKDGEDLFFVSYRILLSLGKNTRNSELYLVLRSEDSTVLTCQFSLKPF